MAEVVIPCVLGKACNLHGFVHGGEAEELRKRLEKLIVSPNNRHIGADEIQRVLDQVDARDSVAFLGDQAVYPGDSAACGCDQSQALAAELAQLKDELSQIANAAGITLEGHQTLDEKLALFNQLHDEHAFMLTGYSESELHTMRIEIAKDRA